MMTRLQEFKKAHPSSFKAPFEAICYLAKVDLKKTYYQDSQTGVSVERTGSDISISSGSRIQWPEGRKIQRVLRDASLDAFNYKRLSNAWSKKETRIYYFDKYEVWGTREKDKVEWAVYLGGVRKHLVETNQLELSDTRAEIVFLNFLSTKQECPQKI